MINLDRLPPLSKSKRDSKRPRVDELIAYYKTRHAKSVRAEYADVADLLKTVETLQYLKETNSLNRCMSVASKGRLGVLRVHRTPNVKSDIIATWYLPSHVIVTTRGKSRPMSATELSQVLKVSYGTGLIQNQR